MTLNTNKKIVKSALAAVIVMFVSDMPRGKILPLYQHYSQHCTINLFEHNIGKKLIDFFKIDPSSGNYLL